MSEGLYSKEVMKHFTHPKNVGVIKDADGIGEAGNILCGDIMRIYIKVKNDKIADIKSQCLGCAVAIANTSLLTTMVKGKKLIDALKITNEDILRKMGKVPLLKYHCSILAIDALSEAVYDFYKKNNMQISTDLKNRHERIQHASEIIEERTKHHTAK